MSCYTTPFKALEFLFFFLLEGNSNTVEQTPMALQPDKPHFYEGLFSFSVSSMWQNVLRMYKWVIHWGCKGRYHMQRGPYHEYAGVGDSDKSSHPIPKPNPYLFGRGEDWATCQYRWFGYRHWTGKGRVTGGGQRAWFMFTSVGFPWAWLYWKEHRIRGKW